MGHDERPRREDLFLLLGQGRFTADLAPAGALVAAFFRAPMAHAAIIAVHVAAAKAAPGIAAVFLMADFDGVITGAPGPLDSLKNSDGSPAPAPGREPLARDRIRFAGEAVALVVGATAAQVQDAIELIDLELAPLAVHLDLAPGGAVLHDVSPDNVALDWSGGDQAATDAAFAAAADVIDLALRIPRIHGLPLEPAAAVASYDPESGRWTLVAPSQGVHTMRRELAVYLGVPEDRLRVVTPDVGGGFGLRIHALAEHAALLAAAHRLGAPISWCATRMESTGCEPHSRDLRVTAALAFDAQDRMLGLRAEACFNIGAYVHPGSRATPTVSLLFGLHGAYRLPCLHLRARGIYTNTTPTGPFRGAGQPEGTYVIERLIDEAARRRGLDPIELRRRNLLAACDFPYRTASGTIADSGDPAGAMAAALDRLGPIPEQGCGRGIALYLKMNGMGRREQCEAELRPDGCVDIKVGSQSNGQGHATAYAALAARTLDLPEDRVRVVQGDSDALAFGAGTGASGALQTTGPGVVLSSTDLLRRAQARAGEQFGSPPEQLDYAGGLFRRPASNQVLGLADLAALGEILVGRSDVGISHSFTIGCHACDIALDPDTGLLEIRRYVAIDDLGHVLKPVIAAGQIQGGVAQGLGQALLEQQLCDETGQPLTLSLMDYAIPRASDLPGYFRTDFRNTRTEANALGVRGAGEAGGMASMAAIVNAGLDAAAKLGVVSVDAPLTPAAMWQALQKDGAIPGGGDTR